MSDGKIHIPARRKQPVDDQMVVKVTPEAYNALVEIYNESTLSLNSGFYQSFEEWTEQNNLDDIFPELDGHDAVKVEVLQSGYLFAPDVDLGRYQMICRLIYK